jgi:hypothetical protein
MTVLRNHKKERKERQKKPKNIHFAGLYYNMSDLSSFLNRIEETHKLGLEANV